MYSSQAKYSQVTDGSTVQPIPNREAYYDLDIDNASDWILSRDNIAEVKIEDSKLIFDHAHSGYASLARYVDNAPEIPKGNTLEATFDIKFSEIEKDCSFDVVGAKIDRTGNENPNSILRIVVDSDEKGVYIYDGSESSPINITQYTNYTVANNKIFTATFRIHAVMNFQTKDTDLDIYTVDDNGYASFETSYRDIGFYNEEMSTALGFYIRSGHGSNIITFSNAVLYQQGEASPTRELYNLSTDINANATDDDANKSNWAQESGQASNLVTYSYNNGDISQLVHSGISDQSGDRYAMVTFEPSTNSSVFINYDISMTTDIDGNGNPSDPRNTYNTFIIKDTNGNNVLSLKSGYDSTQKNEYGIWINDNDITSSIKGDCTLHNTNGITTPILSIDADIDFSTHTITVTITDVNSKQYYSSSISILDSITNVGLIESMVHRADGSYYTPSTTISNLVITQDNRYTPIITPQGDNLTLEVGESISIATVIQYDRVDTEVTKGADRITCEFAQAYSSVVVTGVTEGAASVKITAYNYNGDDSQLDTSTNTRTAELTINVTVTPETHQDIPTPEPGAITDLSSPQPIINITFDTDESSGRYKYFDEYGRTHDETGEQKYTKIENTSNGLHTPAETEQIIPNDPISGDAFYSYLTPQANTQTGNGYRGSFLELDNALIQRTDKIRVSYDFAFYNIVKAAGGENNDELAGIPLAISMTSEAEETSGIPYSFNSLAYDEIDADPSDLTSISKHLLTFMTGRPKRDADGVHFTDMTNRLAYYDPLYGEYRAISNWELLQNAYNYFHVDAEVDFYNDLIAFTITAKGNANNGDSFTATTTIPEHSSWNGFIIASNKWDNNIANDINGQDTEHYAYLDNIVAQKIGEDKNNITPAEIPEAKPVPTDAVILTKTTDNDSTWRLEDVYELLPSATAVAISTETTRGEDDRLDGGYNFTYDIVTGAANDNNNTHIALPSPAPSANGITSYTEFDFYLPKEGSKLTLYMTGSISNTETIGNAISISTAGINSWYGNKNYQSITDQTLDTGVWYTMQVVYDLNDTNMRVTVTQQNNNEPIANGVLVRSRNLVGGYYREVAFNPESIFTGTNGEAPDSTDSPDNTDSYEEFPHKEPSMALAYIANLRIYNRATIEEYYPEGATADTDGDVTINGTNANSERLGVVINNFVRDQVEGGSDAASDYIRSENYPVTPPKSEAGKTFKKWEVIYRNADNESATRIKYAPVYEMLTADSITGDTNDGYYYKVFYTDLPILENNYKTIDWYVYNEDQFRMWGNFDLTNLPHMTGEAEYRIGYVVYNIPDEDQNIIALPQAHHEAMTDDDKAQPTATPLPTNEPTNPGTEAPDMTPPPNAPMPSSAPSPSNAPTPAAQ